MSTTRTKLLKTYLSPEEEATVLQACAAAGVTRSTQARRSLLHWARQQHHGKRQIGYREGPNGAPRRTQSLPCRVNFGITPNVLYQVNGIEAETRGKYGEKSHA